MSQNFIKTSTNYEEMIIGMSLINKYEQKHINIYEEYNPILIKFLVKPLPSILEGIHALLQKYPTDNIKSLATLCSKIY